MLYSSVADAHRALEGDWQWPNFRVSELACRCEGRFCNGSYWHDPRFLDHLQAMRDRVGRPCNVHSGHRCALWNAQVGGAPMSQHKRIAVDLALDGHDRAQLYVAARDIGFTGFGLARSFIHLDLRPKPARWFYHRSKQAWITSLE